MPRLASMQLADRLALLASMQLNVPINQQPLVSRYHLYGENPMIKIELHVDTEYPFVVTFKDKPLGKFAEYLDDTLDQYWYKIEGDDEFEGESVYDTLTQLLENAGYSEDDL